MPWTPEARKNLEKEVVAMISKLDSGRAADLVVRTHAVEVMRTPELLDNLCKILVSSIPRFGSAHLTKITGALAAWALVLSKLDADDRPILSQDVRAFFGGVSTEVSLRLMDVAPGDLSRVAVALASIGLGGVKLFSSLARAAVARSDRFTASELVALVGAFDKARFFHTGLFEALARSLKANIKDVVPRDVLKGMLCLAACGVRDDALAQVVGEQVPENAPYGDLSTEESCSLAWAFCALDLHHEKVFQAVFRGLEETSTWVVISGETLCQLYEIHIALKAFHPETYSPYEIEAEIAQNLRDHYKKYKPGTGHKFKMERSSERLHEIVAEQLKEVIEGSVAMQHSTALGFTVDLAATKKRKGDAFMLVDKDRIKS